MGDNDNVIGKEQTDKDYTKLMYENSCKALMLQRVAAIGVVGIFAVVAIAACILVPKASAILVKTDDFVSRAEVSIENADKTLEEVNEMANSLQQAGDKMDSMLVENEEVLVESMEKISNIDFDGLNEGIQDLKDSVGPLADFMNRFK